MIVVEIEEVGEEDTAEDAAEDAIDEATEDAVEDPTEEATEELTVGLEQDPRPKAAKATNNKLDFFIFNSSYL